MSWIDNVFLSQVAKTFKQGGRINYIDYTHDGLQMITSNEDDAMVLYDCEKVGYDWKISRQFDKLINCRELKAGLSTVRSTV